MRNKSRNSYSIQAMVIDLDGVIWRGENLLHGAVSLFKELKLRDLPYIIATNNSTTTPQELYKRALSYGLEIEPDRILTSSQAAAQFLQDQLPSNAKVFVIGEVGLRNAVEDQSFLITNTSADAQAVVVGLDRDVTWEKMAEAAYAIEAGALFLGTNPDPSLPTERGFAPGTGAILQALQISTGVVPITVGKPEPYLFIQALERLGTRAEETLVLGDRLSTDIQGGMSSGLLTALLLTGATSGYDLQNSTIKPDFVFDNLIDLVREIWKDSQ